MHKCELCEYKCEYQAMGFRPIEICGKAGNLVYAAKAYNAPECPYKVKTAAEQAVEDIRMLGRMGANICPVCAHYNHGEGSKEHCITCIINRETDNFEWRGVKNG